MNKDKLKKKIITFTKKKKKLLSKPILYMLLLPCKMAKVTRSQIQWNFSKIAYKYIHMVESYIFIRDSLGFISLLFLLILIS